MHAHFVYVSPRMPIFPLLPCPALLLSLQPYGLNDTIGCLLDCEAGSIAFSKNGQLLGPAFQLPQARGSRGGRRTQAALGQHGRLGIRTPRALRQTPALLSTFCISGSFDTSPYPSLASAAPARPGAVPRHLPQER